MKNTLSLRKWVVLAVVGTMTPAIAFAMNSYGASPEPGSLTVLGLGLIALGMARKKVRQGSASSNAIVQSPVEAAAE